MNPPLSLREKRSATDIINATFQFIKERFRLLVKSILYIAGPMYLLAGIGGGLYWIAIADAGFGPTDMLDPSTPPPDIFSSQLAGLAYFIMIVTGMIAGLATILTVLVVVRLHEGEGEEVSVPAVWKEVKSYAGRFFVGYLLAAFLGTLALFMGTLVLSFFVAAAFTGGGNIVGIIFAITAAIIGFVVGSYLVITLSVYFPVIVIEGAGLFEGFRRAFYLVRGHFWKALGTLILAFIAYLILAIALSVPNYILLFVQGALGTEGIGAVLQPVTVVFSIVTMLGGALTYCILIVATAMLYYSLVEHKEQVGLSERVDDIGTTLDDERFDQASPSRA